MTRCKSGHLFAGGSCPIDGSSTLYSHELSDAARACAERETPLTIDALRDAGAADAALEHAVILDVPEDWRDLRALMLDGWVIGDQVVPAPGRPRR